MVMHEGAGGKYLDEPWKSTSREHHVRSAMRHLIAFQAGETFDSESEFHHLAHACARLLMACDRAVWGDKPRMGENRRPAAAVLEKMQLSGDSD